MNTTKTADETHFERLRRLLELEAAAERQEMLRSLQRSSGGDAEASGVTLVNLVVREQDAGMGGRILFTMGKRSLNQPLPWTRLTTGTPVLLSVENAAGEAAGWRGIVSRLQESTIQVAFSDWPEVDPTESTFRLDRSTDETARQRIRQGMEKAAGAKESRLAGLREVLLGRRPPAFHPVEDYAALDTGLNESQQEAVRFALSAEDFAILHGPPGTGKTTTLVELIRQIVSRGQTVLAVAPSNLAVDNLLERLVASGVRAIRLGHPARVLAEVRRHTLDLVVEEHPDMRLARRWVREAYMLRGQAARYTRARPEPGERQAKRQEARELLADARKLEAQLVERLLDGARVICATTTGLDRNLLAGRFYDWCIVDEASQSTEPATWIPLQFARRLVLAGDPFQLPPTVISTQAASEGFNISMMERLLNGSGYDPTRRDETRSHISRRLDVQYRMHQDIMAFSSEEFYQGTLVAADPVARHLLQELEGVEANPLTGSPIHFIDTAGAGYEEQVEPDGESRLNPMEANLVQKYVQALLEAGVSPAQIAVIAPYSAQVKLLREQIKNRELEVDSVDGFQGREKEAVVVSLVRSNRDGEIGFLEDVRRMNVALTRARRKLIVIGDSATITVHPFYQRMVSYFDAVGAYHSVWEVD